MIKRKKHILVADDDAVYRDIAADALEKSGHRVTTAADGGEAIALLAAQPFDAAIIDLNMPVANGLDVIASLRMGEINATIPVIVITGHDDASAVEDAYRVGATSFLTKPLNWLLFTPHVEFVLRSGDTENELREASATAAYLSDLKSQMMLALAAEFQKPIKTIFGFSQLIEKEVYGPIEVPAYKDMIADISRSAHALNAALLKVMDFGQSLTDHLRIEVEPVNARDAVLAAIHGLEDQAERREIRIVPEIDIADAFMVQADRALLNQALRSILESAVRLSPRGGDVQLTAGIAADGGLTVTVGDTGQPLPRDLLVEINGPVPGTKPTIAHHKPSADVSIKIAKILTEAHHGRLTIESSVSGGNIVKFTIPRSHKIAPTVATPAPADALLRLQKISEELSDDPRLQDKRGMTAHAPALSALRARAVALALQGKRS
jgi:two-component system, sensor histidine kinase and response regulator